MAIIDKRKPRTIDFGDLKSGDFFFMEGCATLRVKVASRTAFNVRVGHLVPMVCGDTCVKAEVDIVIKE